jgi:hypothetical protein
VISQIYAVTITTGIHCKGRDRESVSHIYLLETKVHLNIYIFSWFNFGLVRLEYVIYYYHPYFIKFLNQYNEVWRTQVKED